MRILVALLIIILAVSCNNNNVAETEDGKQVFNYEPLNWQISVPEGWQTLSSSQLKQLGNAAESFYGEGEEEKEGEKKIIFGARKAEKNINAIYAFIRTYNKGEEEAPDMNELLRQQKEGYNTIPYSAETSVVQENLSGYTFDKATMQVYYDDKPYFKYTTYSTIIDTLNFGVTINSNNAEDERILTELFNKSLSTIEVQ